jgi:ribosomal protein L16 Arg81 hydroxylase
VALINPTAPAVGRKQESTEIWRITAMRDFHFEDYIGDAEAFLAEYFDKRPFLCRQAMVGRLEELQSMVELDEILALEALSPSYIRVTKDGMGVPAKSYRRIFEYGSTRSEAINPEKVYNLFGCGATITWNSLHHFIPSVRRLIRPLGDTFGCRTEAGLFVTPAGNRGFAPHCDSLDVFVIQIDGAKTWNVWATPDVRLGGNASYSWEELGEPVLKETLKPGDVLYVPYGTAHAAAAEMAMSVHLSIGVEPRRWRHLLQETVETIVEDDADFREFPALVGSADGKVVDELERRLVKLAEHLRGMDPGNELRRLAAAGRSRNSMSHRDFERLRSIDGFNGETSLQRGGADIRIGEPAAGRVKLAIGEVQVSVPEALITALGTLEWGHTVKASQFLPGATVSRSVRAAQELARLGLLEATKEN